MSAIQNTVSGSLAVTAAVTASGRFRGATNLPLSGTWAGSVSLRRSFDEGVTWHVVGAAYTANAQAFFFEPQDDVLYQVEFTNRSSGTVVVYMGQTMDEHRYCIG